MEALSWEKLRDYVNAETAAVAPIVGKCNLAFFVGPSARTLGLRIPYQGEFKVDLRAYEELKCQLVIVEGVRTIELSIANPALFHIFYLLAYAAVELIEIDDVSPLIAIQTALERFGLLLVEKTLMPEEKRLGLFGELCFLECFLTLHGESQFSAWLGPQGERHDFRMGNREFEIKATLQRKRKHRIHGLTQLVPSPGKSLFIVSLHFERAGPDAGRTLPERIAFNRNLLGGNRASFEQYLGKLGYRDVDDRFYQARYQLRSLPTLIPVNASCPQLVPELLREPERALINRIDDVSYEIDVEGLGASEGSDLYAQALPGLPSLE